MATEITPTLTPSALVKAGQMANDIAAAHVFSDYQDRKAENTRKRQANDLAVFADYLRSFGLPIGDFVTDPEAWRGVSWGLVDGFTRWQLGEGYAVGSVNVRLSTVKTYAKLALKAGAMDAPEYAMIRAVEGFSRKEGKRADENREAESIPTRKGDKKAVAVLLTKGQAQALKTHPDTPQGRRDALLMCLLLDHGLRCGEVAGLTVGDFDLARGELHFYRPKVDKNQTHKLTPDTLQAARRWFETDAPALGPVLRASSKGGALEGVGMSERAITKRVNYLGRRVGVDGLSAHDCRHFWATTAARNHTPIDRLQDAGGWASPAMPLRYVEAAKIANEGVKLDS